MTMLRKTLVVFSMTLGLAACHPDDGQMTMGDAGMVGVADPGASTGPAAFLGKWRYEAGTSTTMGVCDDGTSFDIDADGTETETFTPGSQANEVVATDNGGCPITCTVSGNTATCSGGETCDGVTITSDVYTFVGGKLHEVASGAVVLDDGTQCQLTAPASVLVRVP
jgi:hypothetical protein